VGVTGVMGGLTTGLGGVRGSVAIGVGGRGGVAGLVGSVEGGAALPMVDVSAFILFLGLFLTSNRCQ